MASFYAANDEHDLLNVAPDFLHALKLLGPGYEVAVEFTVPAAESRLRVQIDALVVRSGVAGFVHVLEYKSHRGVVHGPLNGPWSVGPNSAERNAFAQVTRAADGFARFLDTERPWLRGCKVARSVVLPNASFQSQFMPPPYLRLALTYDELLGSLTRDADEARTTHISPETAKNLMSSLGLTQVRELNGVQMDGPDDPLAAIRRLERRITELRYVADDLERDLRIVRRAASQPAPAPRGPVNPFVPVKPKEPPEASGPTVRQSGGVRPVGERAVEAPPGRDAALRAISTSARLLVARGRAATAQGIYGMAHDQHGVDYRALGFRKLADLIGAAVEHQFPPNAIADEHAGHARVAVDVGAERVDNIPVVPEESGVPEYRHGSRLDVGSRVHAVRTTAASRRIAVEVTIEACQLLATPDGIAPRPAGANSRRVDATAVETARAFAD